MFAVNDSRSRFLTFLAIVVFVCGLIGVSWFVLGALAEEQQFQSLGYAGRGEGFAATFLRSRLISGDGPEKAFELLRRGARTSYYLQRTACGEIDIVQRFNYSILWGSPNIYVIYPGSPSARKAITDIYTDGFSTARSQRIADTTAYRLLNWMPAVR